jgi:uncharacterized Zn finger protein
MSRWDDYQGFNWFRKSVPRQVKGGIRAQSKRGSFGETWWAKRWIQVLDSFNLGARLQRGRSYARGGQVLSIDIGKGRVSAKVQGSRPKPYNVTMEVKPLGAPEWKKVAKAVSSQAIFAAKLLGGALPAEIEQVFQAENVTLFPARVSDLRTDCSCPDWSNPCKHIAAVYYLLAEEFDRDPFLIFRMRGMEREEFGKLLAGFGVVASDIEEEVLPPEPLPSDPAAFWSGNRRRASNAGDVQAPAMPAALVKRLGRLPFWRSEADFVSAMETVYVDATDRAIQSLAATGTQEEVPG